MGYKENKKKYEDMICVESSSGIQKYKTSKKKKKY